MTLLFVRWVKTRVTHIVCAAVSDLPWVPAVRNYWVPALSPSGPSKSVLNNPYRNPLSPLTSHLITLCPLSLSASEPSKTEMNGLDKPNGYHVVPKNFSPSDNKHGIARISINFFFSQIVNYTVYTDVSDKLLVSIVATDSSALQIYHKPFATQGVLWDIFSALEEVTLHSFRKWENHQEFYIYNITV